MKIQMPLYDGSEIPFGGHSSTDAIAGASSNPEHGPSKSDDAGSNPAARTMFLVGIDGQGHEITVETVLAMAESWRRSNCELTAWDLLDDILLDMMEVTDAADSTATEDAKQWTRHWSERLTAAAQSSEEPASTNAVDPSAQPQESDATRA